MESVFRLLGIAVDLVFFRGDGEGENEVESARCAAATEARVT